MARSLRAHPPISPATAGTTCIFGANGVDVEVQFTDQPSCAADQEALASFGLNWYPVSRLSRPGAAGSADGETMAVTCVLDKGASEMTVMDAGGAFYGNQICSAEEQAGWTSP